MASAKQHLVAKLNPAKNQRRFTSLIFFDRVWQLKPAVESIMVPVREANALLPVFEIEHVPARNHYSHRWAIIQRQVSGPLKNS